MRPLEILSKSCFCSDRLRPIVAYNGNRAIDSRPKMGLFGLEKWIEQIGYRRIRARS